MLVVFKDLSGDEIALDPNLIYKVEKHDYIDGMTDISFSPRGTKTEADYITVKHSVLEVVEAVNKVRAGW